MKKSILKVHPSDNVIVALRDLTKGEQVAMNGRSYIIAEDIAAKHKFTEYDLAPGDSITMYGVLVGKAQYDIPAGTRISTANVKHASKGFELGRRKTEWHIPDVSKFAGRFFKGYPRSDGSVGTANHWLIIPMVFCENRNIEVLKESLIDELGFARPKKYNMFARRLKQLYASGLSVQEILDVQFQEDESLSKNERLFQNIDGVKFISHQGGCGGTRQDAQALCGLLAGYITHPNVAGATVLSLGCQNAQVSILQQEISRRDPDFKKPLVLLEQQKEGTENQLLKKAIKQTFVGLIEANKLERKPAPISKLCVGLECGGSDGFSGISANPALGAFSDRLVALNGSVILSEFPELCGVEQELSDRCVDEATALRFMELMRT